MAALAVNDPTIISNSFNNHYCSVGSNTANDLPRSNTNFVDYLTNENFEDMDWSEVTERDIKQIIIKSKNSGPGPDEIPMDIFKNNIDLFAPIIIHLSNLSIRSGIFPSNLKTGMIIPIHKKNEYDNINNYRPICILNSISKILEKAVSIKLINHLENNNLLSDSQYAYRKARSTELAALKLVKRVLENFDRNELLIAVLLDLS